MTKSEKVPILGIFSPKTILMFRVGVEVKRFTENAVHRGAVGSVRFTIRSSCIFGSVHSAHRVLFSAA